MVLQVLAVWDLVVVRRVEERVRCLPPGVPVAVAESSAQNGQVTICVLLRSSEHAAVRENSVHTC